MLRAGASLDWAGCMDKCITLRDFGVIQPGVIHHNFNIK